MNHPHSRLCMTGLLIVTLISQLTFGQEVPKLAFNVPTAITGATVEVTKPVVVIDEQGNITVAWAQRETMTPYSYAIFVAHYDYFASTWTTPKQISNEGIIQYNPEIAIDGQGNVIVAWIYRTSGISAYYVYVARYDASIGWENGWSGATNLARASTINAVRVAMDSTGNGMVVWRQTGGIRASLFDITTKTWQPSTSISSTGQTPSVAYDGLGNAIVVWQYLNDLYAARYTPGQTWPLGWTTLANPISQDIDSSSYPYLAATNATQGAQAGDAMVIWQGIGQASVQAALYDNTLGFLAGWQTPETISSTIATFIEPSVKMDSNGNAVALWQQQDDASNIFSTYFDFALKSWILPAVLISSEFQDAETPALALDNEGNAVATWYRVKENPDTSIELIIQANQNKADKTWFPAHDISLLGVPGFVPDIAINNNHMAAAAWGFPLSNLSISRGLEIPELIAQWVTLGTASAISISASADGIFYLDIISEGIVYTYVHYPDTKATTWTRTQISPDNLYAYELAGSTDVEGNHAITYTARTTTRGINNPSRLLTRRIAYLATMQRRTTRDIGTITTRIISDPDTEDAINPATRFTTTTTRRTRAGNACTCRYFDQENLQYRTGTFTTTRSKNNVTSTRAVNSTVPVSPEGVFLANGYTAETGSATATVWLIKDTEQNITRVQANYQIGDEDPIGYRYISPDGVNVVSTIPPVAWVDSQGSCIFAWVTDNAVQATSFRMTSMSEEWATFIPQIKTFQDAPTPSSISFLNLSDGSGYNVNLTIANTNDPVTYYYNQKTNIWAQSSENTRGLNSLSKLHKNTYNTVNRLDYDVSQTESLNARLAEAATGINATRTTRTTTRTTTFTRGTKEHNTRDFTPTSYLTTCQLDTFDNILFNCITTTVSGIITEIAGATSWTGDRQATATRTRTTTTTTRKSEEDLLYRSKATEEDILKVLLTEPALPKPLPPANVQAKKECYRFPQCCSSCYYPYWCYTVGLVNVLTWQAAQPLGKIPLAVNYQIFLAPDFKTPIAIIDANAPLCFAQRRTSGCARYVYYIYAVDDQGTFSNPVIVRLP